MTAREPSERAPRWPALLPVGYALAITVYVTLRYSLRWADSDTVTILTTARPILAQATISPSAGAYQHGYAYQALMVVLSRVTGLSLVRADLGILPFLAPAIALAAFVTFRALTGNAVLGGIAAVLLFIQPEFVFVVERGSHEKQTQLMVLLLVFLLTATLTRTVSAPALTAQILVFYVLAWALIATNAFFGSSFFASLALALVGGALVLWRLHSPRAERAALTRLIFTVCSGVALVFVFVDYVYGPARVEYGTLRSLLDQMAALFLAFDIQANPYASITTTTGAAWAAPWLYPVLASFDIFATLGALATWIWLARRFWQHGVSASERGRLLLWLFGAAFAIEVGSSVAVDLTGFLGENLEIRLFPMFMVFAIPLMVTGVAAIAERIQPRWHRPLATLSVALLLLFSAIGILKATNDPLVSNTWLFYTPSEQTALTWADRHLRHQEIWSGLDGRLLAMLSVRKLADPSHANRYVTGPSVTTDVRYILMSSVLRNQSPRLGLPVPDVGPDDRIYDNGHAEIDHRVPLTPFQP